MKRWGELVDRRSEGFRTTEWSAVNQHEVSDLQVCEGRTLHSTRRVQHMRPLAWRNKEYV
jgi:hypothetical protein